MSERAAELAKKEMEALRRSAASLDGDAYDSSYERKIPKEITKAVSQKDSETVANAVAEWLKVAPLPDPNKEIEKALERLRT